MYFVNTMGIICSKSFDILSLLYIPSSTLSHNVLIKSQFSNTNNNIDLANMFISFYWLGNRRNEKNVILNVLARSSLWVSDVTTSLK